MDLVKNIKYGTLLDYYESLLTVYQAEVMRLYFDRDMSLQEISEEFGVTRQAIHDIIDRSSKKLVQYEEKLGLISKLSLIKKDIVEILDRAENTSKTELVKDINSILLDIKEI